MVRKTKISVALAALVLLASCASPGGVQDDKDGWGYVVGPHGEHCLVYTSGMGTTQMMGMSCDSVNWESK